MQRFALFLSALGAVGAVLALVLLVGTSPGNQVVARAGTKTLTVAEFERLAEQAATRYPFPPDSAKSALVNDWMQRALLVESAKHNPVVIDSLVRRYHDQVEIETLVNALAQQMAPRDVAVSDAEVRRFWQSRGQETRVQIVYAIDRRAVRAAQEALRRGEPFGSVSDRFSLAGMLPPGGDVGFVAPGGLVNPLDHIVQTTPVGTIAGPIEAPGQGWFLVRVLDRRPRERAAYEVEAPQLRTMLGQRKQRLVATRAFKALREQYGVRTNAEGIAILFQHLNTPPLIQGFGGEAVPPPPSPEDRRAELGVWDGGPGARGRYTLADALADLDAGRGERPPASMMPALEQWVTSRILEKVATIEAKRRHLNEQPEVAKRIEDSVDNYRVEGAYDMDVSRRAETTPADLQAAYDANVGSLAQLLGVTVQYLTLPDSGAAMRALDQVRAHPTMREAVLLSSAGMQVREEVVRFPTGDPVWTVLQGEFRREPVGTYFPPVRTADGWRLVQMTARDMPTPPFGQLPPGTQQALFQEATERARQRRLTAYTDSLRTVIPTSIDRGVLSRAKWPMPMMMGMDG